MNYPRVGHINFLNVLPLTYAYFNGFSNEFALTLSVPSYLNDALKNNFLDVSPVSSMAYAKYSDKFFLLPDVCIRAEKKVTSIILISKKEIEKLDGKKISLTDKSATSQCLVKMIFKKYNLSPNYEEKNLCTENPLPDDSDASLFIGDDALKIFLHPPENFFVYDVAELWHKLTGHFMTYAVWAVEKNFAKNSPELLQKVYEKISAGFEFGLKNKSSAINSLTENKFFSFDELNKYLGEIIKWDLNSSALDDLKFFCSSAREMKFLNSIPNFEIAPVKKINEKNL